METPILILELSVTAGVAAASVPDEDAAEFELLVVSEPDPQAAIPTTMVAASAAAVTFLKIVFNFMLFSQENTTKFFLKVVLFCVYFVILFCSYFVSIVRFTIYRAIFPLFYPAVLYLISTSATMFVYFLSQLQYNFRLYGTCTF